MKIRTDFVTNSSSVSFIIMMDLDILDCFLEMNESLYADSEPVVMAQKGRGTGTCPKPKNQEFTKYTLSCSLMAA